MSNIKLIIVIEGGVVKAVHANKDMEYVVIDNAGDADQPGLCLLGQPNTPDSVDDKLSLERLSETEVPDIRINSKRKDHPWWKKSI